MDNSAKQLFNNRKAILATMHNKELVIAPIFQSELGLNIIVPENFDTDTFGTFTSEIQRTGDQLEAARFKIEAALKESKYTIGVASEGSFGPHPYIPYLPFNRELVLFIDKELGLEVIGFCANSNTNYSHKKVSNYKEAHAFALEIGFPEHGVILKKDLNTTELSEIIKGITNQEQLEESANKMLKITRGSFIIETDMRAMYNPTRMKNIELATLDLVSKLKSTCPSCSTPGYEITEYKKGLLCELCGTPTELILAHVYQCKKCMFKEDHLFPNGNEYADPSRCNWCNP